MSKTIKITYTTPCVLHSKRRGYWQCGVWVGSEGDATVYPNEEEAALVRGLRCLERDTEIVFVKYVA